MRHQLRQHRDHPQVDLGSRPRRWTRRAEAGGTRPSPALRPRHSLLSGLSTGVDSPLARRQNPSGDHNERAQARGVHRRHASCTTAPPPRLHPERTRLHDVYAPVHEGVDCSKLGSRRTWAEIGAMLGVTRQAAQHKYAPALARTQSETSTQQEDESTASDPQERIGLPDPSPRQRRSRSERAGPASPSAQSARRALHQALYGATGPSRRQLRAESHSIAMSLSVVIDLADLTLQAVEPLIPQILDCDRGSHVIALRVSRRGRLLPGLRR